MASNEFGGTDPVQILEQAARSLREHYLQARAAVAEMALELDQLLRKDNQAANAKEREADLAELRTGMRDLRARYEQLEEERREALIALSAAGLRLKVQQLLSTATPGRMAEALDDARRQVALKTAEADVGGGSLDAETRLELEKIERLARALRLAERK